MALRVITTELWHFSLNEQYLVFLDDAVLVFGGWRVPGNADRCAVLTAYHQHRHLLWRSTGGCPVQYLSLIIVLITAHTHTHTKHLPTPHTHTKASRNPNGFLMAFLNDPDIWANYCPLTIINTVGENSYCATSRLFGLPWATNIHEACTVLSNVTPFLHRCTVYNFAHLHR